MQLLRAVLKSLNRGGGCCRELVAIGGIKVQFSTSQNSTFVITCEAICLIPHSAIWALFERLASSVRRG
jgi:hypothetical protein